MLTTRQWISVALNIVTGHALLLAAGAKYEDFIANPRGSMGLSAVAVVLMVLAFKFLRWDASWRAIVPASLLVSSGVPFIFFAAHFLQENLLGALFVGITMTIAAFYLVLPMFLLNCLLLRWGTRSRRTNR